LITIKKINIHALRGISDLELFLEGKNLILKGENGTGKSSIVEAFEFFFTGRLRNFTGIEDLSLQKHVHHKNFYSNDISVKVIFDPGNTALERTFYSTQQPPTQLRAYFSEAEKGAFILRRSQILEFIVSKPADKFRALASIIGIEQLDATELSLKRAYETLEDDLSSKKQGVDSIYTNISAQLGQRINNSNQGLAVLNSKLATVGLSPISSFKDVSLASADFSKNFKHSIDFEYMMNLDSLMKLTEHFKINPNILSMINLTASELEPLLIEQSREDILIRDFLSNGQETIERTKSGSCPLCGQEIEREVVLERIKDRLRTLEELSNKTDSVRHIFIETDFQLTELLNFLQKVSGLLDSVRFYELKQKLSDILNELSTLRACYAEAKIISPQKLIPSEGFGSCFNRINDAVDEINSKSKALFQSTELSSDWK
jgi:hypothetical protein